MRIGITMLSHDATWGGIGIYTREIVRQLLSIDPVNEYVLIYPGFGDARRDLGQYAAEHPNCTEIETRRSLKWTTYWDQVVVPPVARRFNLDVLFNPFWSVSVFASCARVVVVHGVDAHVVPESLTLRVRLDWALHSRIWIHAADAVVSISDVMTGDLKRYVQLPAERIRRIYHGCSASFRPIADEHALASARRQFDLPEKYLLFVGMLFPQKNFGTLLRAFHKLSGRIPHSIVVVGRPRWKYAADLRLVRELGLGARVRMLDHVANEDLPLIYNLADCFVFPSLYEAFGLAGVEAMACGCPVAAANAGALPEVLGDAALFFDPRDVDGMAERIHTLIHDPAVRDTCVRKGLERARSFTWERAARELLRLFHDVAERRARRA